jgi:Na+-transporting NADH:ubiquinone oxidoreductase subunit C
MQQEPEPKKLSQNAKTILFMVILSFACALILSLLASSLAERKEIAKDLDRSRQMLIAAQILDYKGYFLIADAEEKKRVPAKYTADAILVPGSEKDIATETQVLDVYKKRLVPLLTNNKGDVISFKDAGIQPSTYLTEYRKTGYYKQPNKLLYEILPNSSKETANSKPKPEGYVIPINGFGLWDAIYGYLALKTDGNTVIGITWYDQKETPGLGANISEPYWQNQFLNKRIFQETASGETNFKTAPLGLTVVKGKVSEVLGDSPKAKSAVDGMTGATLTGNGVNDAYREVLAAYRPFLIKVHEENAKTDKE